MATQTPPSVPDTSQLRAELREIMEERSLLDDIEGDLERARSKEDDERTKKRKQKDADIARKREVADGKREARQEELCRREDAVRTKLKGYRTLGTSPYLTPPAGPSVRTRAEFEVSNSTNPSSDSREHGTHKRPRTCGPVPTTTLSQPRVSDNETASGEGRKRVSSQAAVIDLEELEATTPSMNTLQDMVPLPQIQSLPPAEGIANLSAFAAMPSFTRGVISEFLGGSSSGYGFMAAEVKGEALLIVQCHRYLVLNPATNPYVPSTPGQHFVYLHLVCSWNFGGNKRIPRRIFPVFLSAGNRCWYYSGHYAESIVAEKVQESTQRQLMSEAMLDEWVDSLFENKDKLTNWGSRVLSNSSLYEYRNKWNNITKETVKLAMRTKRRNTPYTQVPFWFRFLQCVCFDHAFHDALVGKKLEIASQVQREP